MRKPQLLIASALLGLAATPSLATIVPPATGGVAITAFDTSTQGTLLDSNVLTGQSLTFAGSMAVAVYRNTLGTLDFYYQFARTGAGTQNSDAVERITGANFAGYTVDALFSDADLDGAGIFTASNNPGAAATARRNLDGGVVGVDLDPSNPLAGTEISSTYIFRTNATEYEAGTFGVIDGSSFQGISYQPTGAVPEPATWAMFILGFGAAGAAMRRGRKRTLATATTI